MGNAKTIMMGSLNDPDSYISRLWTATVKVSVEAKDGSFILQNLQDKDRIACGNNRQRGKIALDIFRKLGYIQKIGSKGNSTKFKLTGTKPFAVTLDEIFTRLWIEFWIQSSISHKLLPRKRSELDRSCSIT